MTFSCPHIRHRPEASKPTLREVEARFGMIPNLAAAMATSPVLIQSFLHIFDKVHGGSFSEQQIQTVLLTDAVTNASTWAVALHSALGLQAGLDPEDVEAMRPGARPRTTRRALDLGADADRERGRLDERTPRSSWRPGSARIAAFEVITIVAASTITNYTGSDQSAAGGGLQAHAWNGASILHAGHRPAITF